MTKTKQEMYDEAYEAYEAIRYPMMEAYKTADKLVWDNYVRELNRIESLPNNTKKAANKARNAVSKM